MKFLASHEGRHRATPLLGQFCHEYGQPMHSELKRMHHMAEETVETVLHIDSRIVRTLPPLLLKPGFLTLVYFAGRHVRYIAPFRLMSVLCLLSFFVLHLATPAAIDHDPQQHQQKVPSDRGSDFAQATSADGMRKLLDDTIDALDAVQAFGDDSMAAQGASVKQLSGAAANQRWTELHTQPLPLPAGSAATPRAGRPPGSHDH